MPGCADRSTGRQSSAAMRCFASGRYGSRASEGDRHRKGCQSRMAALADRPHCQAQRTPAAQTRQDRLRPARCAMPNRCCAQACAQCAAGQQHGRAATLARPAQRQPVSSNRMLPRRARLSRLRACDARAGDCESSLVRMRKKSLSESRPPRLPTGGQALPLQLARGRMLTRSYHQQTRFKRDSGRRQLGRVTTRPYSTQILVVIREFDRIFAQASAARCVRTRQSGGGSDERKVALQATRPAGFTTVALPLRQGHSGV